MWFFRKQQHFADVQERFLSLLKILAKSAVMMILPLPFPLIVCFFWYHVMYQNDIHFDQKLETIVTSAWLPTFGITYGLFATNVINTVWQEYKSIRAAVKTKDFRTFFLLRDEEVSPLAHIILIALAGTVVFGFMGLKYPGPQGAMVILGSLAYVFALIFVVVGEIDNPCSGIWFIKSIPQEWIDVDVKEWRKHNFDSEEQDFKNCLERCENKPKHKHRRSA
jgi:hypothetical protein